MDRAIWFREWRLEELVERTQGTLVDHLGISFTQIAPDALYATMPVAAQTAQRMGYLHGGASMALAETVGSLASQMCVDDTAWACMGLDLNANHVRPVPKGEMVVGIARPLHLGRTSHVWDVRVENAAGKLVCIARLTTSVVARSTK